MKQISGAFHLCECSVKNQFYLRNVFNQTHQWIFIATHKEIKLCTGDSVIMFISHSKYVLLLQKKKQNQKYFHENSFLFSSLVVSVPIDRGKREAEIHKVIYYPLNINGCYRNCGLRSYKVKCLCRALTKDG